MKEKENIAILLFSRSAKQESYSKQWTNDEAINLRIAEHLISNTYDNLKTAPFPIFRIDEKLQVGITFGKRLANAFSYVFQKGFKYVIAVGNDSPSLQINWHDISRQLINQNTVLGPDKRGGVYLIGLSEDSGFESTFMQISWKSRLVCHQLKEKFANYCILKSMRDINTFQDVISWEYLFKRIKGLLYKRNLIPLKFSIIPNYCLSLDLLRAPPVFFNGKSLIIGSKLKF